jgi:hypothetical protein
VSAITNLALFFSSHPLTRDAPVKAWARFAVWQLRSRLQQEVLFHWVARQRLAVRRGMTGATGNVYVGLHEFADMMVCLHFQNLVDRSAVTTDNKAAGSSIGDDTK